MRTTPHLSADTLARSWSALLQQTGDVVLLIDADGTVLAASAQALDLLGSQSAVIGENLYGIFSLAPGAALAGPAALPGGRGLVLHSTPLDGKTEAPAAQLVFLSATASTTDNAAEHQLELRLREVTLAISSALDIDEILDRVVRLSVELLGADAGSLPLYDARRDCLLPSYLVNLEIPMRSHHRGQGAIWSVIDTGQPYRSNSYSNDPRALRLIKDQQIHATLGVAVMAGDQVLGVLIMYHFRHDKVFSARDEELLEIIGRQAGVAIQNARLYATALRISDRRALLHKASVNFGAALTTGELYAAIHRAAASLVRCDSCAIGLLDAQSQEIDYVYMADQGRTWPPERGPAGKGLLGYVMRTGVSLRLINCAEEVDALFGAQDFGDSGTPSHSIIAVVLTVADSIIGAITAQSTAVDAYSQDDLDAMETLAATAAIAIQNAHLFAKVQELATRDELTGVFNRRHFFELARRELERATRYAHPVSLLMLDADYFKQINDTYGHLVGDQVLQAIAARVRETLREVDVVARYGGEEFLVLLPETGRAAALLAAERLHEQISRTSVETDEGPVSVSVSIGVASYEAGQIRGVDRLLDHVDRALYEAKRSGRNQTRVYLDPSQEVR